MVRRVLVFGYGVFSYLAGLVALLYAIAFIGNLFVPTSLDAPPTVPLRSALLVNLALLTLFAVQHSGMARRGFKQWLAQWLSPVIERSTYVLASGVVLLLLCWQWQPLGGEVWRVTQPAARVTLYALCILGWLLLLLSTFAIDHLDLFGLSQVWRHLLGRVQRPVHFKLPLLYRIVRHPLYVGLLLGCWSTPHMTLSHLLFALGATGYILVGVRLEERDLERMHPEYRDYRRNVPMFIPRLTRGRRAQEE